MEPLSATAAAAAMKGFASAAAAVAGGAIANKAINEVSKSRDKNWQPDELDQAMIKKLTEKVLEEAKRTGKNPSELVKPGTWDPATNSVKYSALSSHPDFKQSQKSGNYPENTAAMGSGGNNNPGNLSIVDRMNQFRPLFSDQSSFSKFLHGTPTGVQQFQNYSPEQQQAMSSLLQKSLGGLNNINLDFGPIANQAKTQFAQSTYPNLMEGLSNQGAGNLGSSALARAMTQSKGDLATNLAGLQSRYNLDAHQALRNLSALGLTPQFENVLIPGQEGFLHKAAGNLGGAAINGLESKLIQWLNGNQPGILNQFKQWYNQNSGGGLSPYENQAQQDYGKVDTSQEPISAGAPSLSSQIANPGTINSNVVSGILGQNAPGTGWVDPTRNSPMSSLGNVGQYGSGPIGQYNMDNPNRDLLQGMDLLHSTFGRR